MRKVAYDDQIFRSQQFGGISRYICEVASRVSELPDWTARIIAPLHLNEYLTESAVPHRGLVLDPTNPRSHGRCRHINRLLMNSLLRLYAPDVVHQTYYSDNSVRRPMKIIVTVHDMIHELFPQDFVSAERTTAVKRLSVLRADHIICVSQNTAEDLIRIFEVPRTKISVIHHGFSRSFARSVGEEGPSVQRPYFLFVGHRGGYKNFTRALTAFGASGRLTREFDFVAFGGGAFNAVELDLIDSLQLRGGAVRHEGGSDLDLARMYAGAYAFVYPSEYEGFGIPVLEAMSSGCPVACSNTSSVPEVAGDAAEYFDPTSVDAIRIALENLSDDQRRRTALIKAGRRQSEIFSWDRCAAQHAAVYSAVLND